jgi:hypothetical protein
MWIGLLRDRAHLQRFSFTTGSRLFVQLETLGIATHQFSIWRFKPCFWTPCRIDGGRSALGHRLARSLVQCVVDQGRRVGFMPTIVMLK